MLTLPPTFCIVVAASAMERKRSHVVLPSGKSRTRLMLLRKDGLDVIAIPQPSHAWLSGQLASAWGNQRFAAPTPNDEVCLAAEQHDIGWLRWEAAPVLDARTGLPQEFCHVPAITHTALWGEGVRRARAFGRYPALLVSLHADTIYALTFNFAKASPRERGGSAGFSRRTASLSGADGSFLAGRPEDR